LESSTDTNGTDWRGLIDSTTPVKR
jgi:hypothetical protein